MSVNKSHREFANPHIKVGRSNSQERYQFACLFSPKYHRRTLTHLRILLFRIIGVYGSSTNGYFLFVNYCHGFAAILGWLREAL